MVWLLQVFNDYLFNKEKYDRNIRNAVDMSGKGILCVPAVNCFFLSVDWCLFYLFPELCLFVS